MPLRFSGWIKYSLGVSAALAIIGAIVFAFQQYRIYLANPLPSSAASIAMTRDPNLFLVADYSSVFLFDRRDDSVKPVVLIGGTRPNVPTGLAYDPKRDRVFIANYRSNNVLIARLDLKRRSLTVEKEFATDAAISPENIAIDPNTGDVAIANYDGSDVQIWSEEDTTWRKRCSTPAKEAHGVVFEGGWVFATALESAELLKISASNCSIKARVGRRGWGNSEFLWPTAVGVWGPGEIAVSDAHTGKLQVFGTDQLAFITSFGGNGPAMLNMPYSFVKARDGSVLVLSTFGYEAIEFDSAGNFVQRHGKKHRG